MKKVYHDIGQKKSIKLCVEGCGRQAIGTGHYTVAHNPRCEPCSEEHKRQCAAASRGMGA